MKRAFLLMIPATCLLSCVLVISSEEQPPTDLGTQKRYTSCYVADEATTESAEAGASSDLGTAQKVVRGVTRALELVGSKCGCSKPRPPKKDTSTPESKCGCSKPRPPKKDTSASVSKCGCSKPRPPKKDTSASASKCGCSKPRPPKKSADIVEYVDTCAVCNGDILPAGVERCLECNGDICGLDAANKGCCSCGCSGSCCSNGSCCCKGPQTACGCRPRPRTAEDASEDASKCGCSKPRTKCGCSKPKPGKKCGCSKPRPVRQRLNCDDNVCGVD